MRNHASNLLQTALAGIASASEPKVAGEALLRACAGIGTQRGRIYLIDLGTGRLVPFAGQFSPSEWQEGVPAEGRKPDQRLGSLAELLDLSDKHPADLPGVAAYGFRGKTCVGALALDGVELDELGKPARDELQAAANLLVAIYESNLTFKLLKCDFSMLDFTQSESGFLQQAISLVARVSSMEFGALWEIAGEQSRCINCWGIEEDRNPEALGISLAKDFPPFADVLLRNQSSAVPEIALFGSTFAREAESSGIKSLVAVPVRSDSAMSHVLILGASCSFDYTPIEILGFESIAAGLGVSIANFRNSQTLASEKGEFAASVAAMTAVEVALAARHEAMGYIDNCNATAHRLWRKLGRDARLVEPELDAFSDGLKQIKGSLDRFRLVARPPDDSWRRVLIRQQWEEAQSAVGARLIDKNITTKASGPDIEVETLSDGLLQVFLNLLMNSIDAFSEGRKGVRRIELSVEPPSDRSREIRIAYRDNGTGINRSQLSVPDRFKGEPISQLLFESGVTSKRHGTGLGLWLVRKNLQDLGGSIDLVDHRGGVKFAIRLPNPDNAPVGRA